MGNITNPVINRLGKSIFWNAYKVTNKLSNSNKNLLIFKFIYFIIWFNFKPQTNELRPSYWYFNFYSKLLTKKILSFSTFYVKAVKKIKGFESILFYKRRSLKIIYPFKIWVLFFKSILFINWCFFKPILLKNLVFSSKINKPTFLVKTYKHSSYFFLSHKVYNF